MKRPIYLYIELFMCCLTYSYIAIIQYLPMYSSKPFVQRRKKRRKGEEKEQ